MKPKNAVFTPFVFTIILLLMACGQSTRVNQSMETVTLPPSATPTSLLLPTETITPTPQDNFVTQNCLTMPQATSAGYASKGIIPLDDHQALRTVFLNLETGDKTKIPAIERYMASSASAVSPDRKTLAYKISENGSYLLVLRDVLNKNYKVILQRQNDFALYDWLNNQQLFLGMDGKWVIFNPDTQQEKIYTVEDLPDYSIYTHLNDWVGIDPQGQKAIYKAGSANTVLLDLGSKQVLAKIPDIYDRPPVAEWTLDGAEAAIVGATQLGKARTQAGDNIFGVNRDGQVTQLTHLAEQYGVGFIIHSLSWSPDSRSIAFWMRLPGTSEWQLAILDTSTKKVTNYCISTDPYAANGGDFLVWSPDGKQIIIMHPSNDTGYVVLVDITQSIAFQIAQNASPLGWMLPSK